MAEARDIPPRALEEAANGIIRAVGGPFGPGEPEKIAEAAFEAALPFLNDGLNELLPAERIALTVATAQLERGENPPLNTTAALALGLARLARGGGQIDG